MNWSTPDNRDCDEIQELPDGSFESTSVPLFSGEVIEHWAKIFEFNLYSEVAEEKRKCELFSYHDVSDWLKDMYHMIEETNRGLRRQGIIYAEKEVRNGWQSENDHFLDAAPLLAAKFERQYKEHLSRSEEMIRIWADKDYAYFEGEIVSPLSSVEHRKKAGKNAIDRNCDLYMELIDEWTEHQKQLKRTIKNLWTDPTSIMEQQICDLRNEVNRFCTQHERIEA